MKQKFKSLGKKFAESEEEQDYSLYSSCPQQQNCIKILSFYFSLTVNGI
jgi:hypothetical protein